MTQADLNKALISSCMHGDFNEVRRLVLLGADPNTGCYLPLSLLCTYADLEMIEFLIEHGADVTGDESKALRAACQIGLLDVADLLIRHGADPLVSETLAAACEGGCVSTIKRLQSMGANLKSLGIDSVIAVIEYFQAEMLHFILLNRPDISPKSLLKYATKYNSLECASVLMDFGAKPNFKLKMTDEMRAHFLAYKLKHVVGTEKDIDRVDHSEGPGL